jgi:hypothetical protein
MADITYHQLLAQQYQENARINSTDGEDEYPGEGYNVEEHNPTTGRYQLEEAETFRNFAGNRNAEDVVLKGANFEDKSKLSVRYNKDVRTSVFSIDTRFRAYSATYSIVVGGVETIIQNVLQSTAHFVFRFSRQVKNAISIKMSSLELPNTFANFVQSRNNTCFGVRVTGSGVPYTKIDIATSGAQYLPSPILLVSVVETALQSCGLADADKFTCTVIEGGYIQISNNNTNGILYDFDFTTNVTTPRLFSTNPSSVPREPQLFDTLGTSLGFHRNYSGDTTVTAIYLPDTNVDDYIYLVINDYSSVIPQTLDNTYFSVFAKIPITVAKGAMLFDTESVNATRKIYQFLQPENIQTLDIKLLDKTGVTLSNTQDYSMTLEIEEVVSHALYEKLREL